MIFDVNHKTRYRYASPVIHSQHVVHMSPRTVPRQTIRHHSLMIEPAPATRYDGLDAFGNPVVMLDVEASHCEFILHARSTIETRKPDKVDLSATAPWDTLDDHLVVPGEEIDLEVVQFRCASRLTLASLDIAGYAARSLTPRRPVLEAAFELACRIHDDFTFDSTATDVSTPIDQAFRQRRGVCQDFAHLALAGLRAMRVPARYVSGYILTSPPPGHPKLEGADASHAWFSVWSPEAGWVDMDPTNALVVQDEHITIAYGRDYDDVSPISGVLLGGAEHTVSVGVDVVPRG
jgi:transglutaminase-like putative cysteine protease